MSFFGHAFLNSSFPRGEDAASTRTRTSFVLFVSFVVEITIMIMITITTNLRVSHVEDTTRGSKVMRKLFDANSEF